MICRMAVEPMTFETVDAPRTDGSVMDDAAGSVLGGGSRTAGNPCGLVGSSLGGAPVFGLRLKGLIGSGFCPD